MSKNPLMLAFFLLLFAGLATAFGAGDVPKEHGLGLYVWRHGDIAQLLLSLPASFATNYAFSELEKRQIYFGNWLRDLSQIVDTAMLENVSEELLRTIVAILAFMHFGFATDEFDVTKERLGCYQHVEHIELDLDPKTGMKNYIANSGKGWDTSAEYVKQQLELSIQKGREGREKNDDSIMADAYRHLGGALHTLEDFSAHSNFIELCLLKLGVENVFAYVGDECRIESPLTKTSVPPLVTGTFGMLDALQSIVGEADDRAITMTRGELGALDDMMDIGGMAFETLYGILRRSANVLASISTHGADILQDLDKVNDTVTSLQQDPSKFDPVKHKDDTPNAIWEAIEPAFRVHDNISKWIMERKDLLISEQLQKAANQVERYIDTFVYKLLSIVIEPLIKQVRNAVKQGRVALLEEEKRTQEMSDDGDKKNEHVLHPGSDDSNPSHSLIAKDHFSNVLNPPSGLIATVTSNWTTQQIVRCWDDPEKDQNAVLADILGILHHPSFVDGPSFIQKAMLECVDRWWGTHSTDEQASICNRLQKSGVEKDLNNDHHLTEAHFAGKPRGFGEFHGSRPETLQRPNKDLGVAQLLDTAAKSLSGVIGEGPSSVLTSAASGVVSVVAASGIVGMAANGAVAAAAATVGTAVGVLPPPAPALDEHALAVTLGCPPSAELVALLHGWKAGKVAEDEFMRALQRQRAIVDEEKKLLAEQAQEQKQQNDKNSSA